MAGSFSKLTSLCKPEPAFVLAVKCEVLANDGFIFLLLFLNNLIDKGSFHFLYIM